MPSQNSPDGTIQQNTKTSGRQEVCLYFCRNTKPSCNARSVVKHLGFTSKGRIRQHLANSPPCNKVYIDEGLVSHGANGFPIYDFTTSTAQTYLLKAPPIPIATEATQFGETHDDNNIDEMHAMYSSSDNEEEREVNNLSLWNETINKKVLFDATEPQLTKELITTLALREAAGWEEKDDKE